ncbi:MAG TPA: 4-hydroxy-tetrahydrodipicolinate synthase [Rhodanobacteraceae bacterium]|nr:4-hydroxy-tetrahydrodipicolinate synthase [Rhodanobacteraceae bacterium]
MALSGSITALATPFGGRDDALDLDACGRLIDAQLAAGTRAIVMAGSTGEAAALDEREFSTLLEFAVAHIGKRVPVLAGTGLSATRKTIAQTQRARDAGVDIALVVAPAYVRPTQEGMYRHFSEIAERGGLPVVLYNVPSRTSCDVLPETVARLAGHGNIIGIKEARAEPERMQALLGLQGDGFSVLSGDDPTAMRAMLAGAAGVVSVASNVAPAEFSALCAHCASRDAGAARAIDERLQPLYEFLGVEPNPIPVKWCLAELGFGTPQMRLPLVPLSAVHHAKGRQMLLQLGLIEPARAVG